MKEDKIISVTATHPTLGEIIVNVDETKSFDSGNLDVAAEIKKNEFNWISIKDEGYPKLKIGTIGNLTTIEASKECICFDGETIFKDDFCCDEGFHPSITHYIIIEEIKPPTT